MRRIAFSAVSTVLVLCSVGCNSAAPIDPSAPVAPAHGYQLAFGPFDVAAGREVQLCRTMKLPNTERVAINRLEVLMKTGSHHFIIFRSKQDFPDQVFPCWGTVNFEEWDFVMDVNKTGGADWQLNEGQAFIMEPHQQVMVQSHFVNARSVQTPDGGMAYLNLHTTPMDTIQHELRGMFTVNTRIHLEPNVEYTTSKMCTPSRDIRIAAMTGHFHARGTQFDVDQVALDDENLIINPMYRSGSWDSPVFEKFTKPPFVAAGTHGLKFSCSYFNDASSTGIATSIGFGGHADVQEHCNLFFQYYNEREGSTEAPLTCAEGSGGW